MGRCGNERNPTSFPNAVIQPTLFLRWIQCTSVLQCTRICLPSILVTSIQRPHNVSIDHVASSTKHAYAAAMQHGSWYGKLRLGSLPRVCYALCGRYVNIIHPSTDILRLRFCLSAPMGNCSIILTIDVRLRQRPDEYRMHAGISIIIGIYTWSFAFDRFSDW